jgi:Family of unknown function (DUF6113)
MRFLDPTLRVAALVVAAGLGAVTAIYEALLSALYWHGDRVPLSVVLALLANPLLVRLAYRGTGRLVAGLAPAVPWIVVMVLSADRTAEGDLIFAGNNWVGLATLFVGSIAFALGVVRWSRAAAVSRPATPTVSESSPSTPGA